MLPDRDGPAAAARSSGPCPQLVTFDVIHPGATANLRASTNFSLSSSNRSMVALRATNGGRQIRKGAVRSPSPDRVLYNQIEDEQTSATLRKSTRPVSNRILAFSLPCTVLSCAESRSACD